MKNPNNNKKLQLGGSTSKLEEVVKKEISCDVAIVGGGPAGMMAAITASKGGAQVILVEKNKTLGKKLLITGGGRCNITNAIFDNRALAQKYGKKGKFLLSPFSKWSAENTINFFESRGCPTKIEAENRVFPQSNSAQSVWNVLTRELKSSGVKVLAGSPVIKVTAINSKIINMETSSAIIHAKTFIITTGGTARPETGSTGDGFKFLKKLGHTVSTPSVALVPVKIKEVWAHKLQGLSLSNVKITLRQAQPLASLPMAGLGEERTGKILFTHFGLSGPLVLGMSHAIGEVLREGIATLELDLFPALDQTILDKKLRAYLSNAQNKKWSNALAGFIPPRLAKVIIELAAEDPEIFVNKLPRTARLATVRLMKNLMLTPTGLLAPEKAIVSSGGARLEEIDFKTMRSQKIENLYLAGDILDFDRPSGGFSLQICWATGKVAGINAALHGIITTK